MRTMYHKHIFFVLLPTIFALLWGLFLFKGLDEDPFSIAPALYKGRFRPVEAVQDQTRDELLLFPSKKRPMEWLSRIDIKKGTPAAYDESVFQNTLPAYLAFREKSTHRFPTLLQLKTEVFYLRYDLLAGATVFYFLSAFFYVCTRTLIGDTCFALALFLHAALLGMRVFILERPPVSNMQESLLFVPFGAVVLSLFFLKTFPKRESLMAASLLAGILLALARFSFVGEGLEIAPAVLNSRFWLTIHVLMVVSSYAFFLLAGVLAHIHLLTKDKALADSLSRAILNILYAGTFFLISGTILGGIWAQQSWGRFWDWDPKESWAFISSCLYLILIHLYRFGHIGKSGLSYGAILGILFIGFTWYGVNYLIGTGLHSYGFGSGGAIWFVLFSALELTFLGTRIKKSFAS